MDAKPVKQEPGVKKEKKDNADVKSKKEAKGAPTKKAAVKEEKPSKKSPAEKPGRKAKKADTAVKKERKVYELPGQKHDPPEERDPLRIFYESLYKQRPDSEMAQIWMMEHGLLDEEEAIRVLDTKNKKAGKVVSTPKKAANGTKKAPAKRPKKEETDSDDEDEPIVAQKRKRR